MAMSTIETQVTWATANFRTVTSGVEVVSDTFILGDACVAASVQVSADNSGTPASGDTAICRIQWSNGDVLGNTGDDFDTTEHAEHLGMLDTFLTNTPGEDPARRTYHLHLGGSRKLRIAVTCPNAASRNIVVMVRIVQQLVA